jgi:signal transduction histidine kinase
MRSRHCLALLLVVLLQGASSSAPAQVRQPWRVIVMYSYGRDFAPLDAVGTEFRTQLAKRAARPVDFYEVSLDSARQRQSNDAEDGALIQYLVDKFADRKPDLIVTLGGPATQFFLTNRSKLFTLVPLLAGGVEMRMLEDTSLGPRDAVVGVRFDHPAVLATIMALRPETRKVLVVLGASGHERRWADIVQRDLAPYEDRVALSYTNDLSLEQMRKVVASLPDDAAILYHRVSMDAGGVPHEQNSALDSLHEVARVPIFGVFENQLGHGIVGGPLMSLNQVGRAVAESALRILGGEPPNRLAPVEFASFSTAFDWRELQRWKISEELLPAGSTVYYRPPSPWEMHRDAIVAGTALILVQMIFIAVLIVQRARLEKAEKATRELSQQLLSAHEDERRRLARDLHDDFSHRVAMLSMDAARLERADSAEEAPRVVHNMRQGLSRLSEDLHELSHRLHPSILEDLGLVDALRTECDQLSRAAGLKVVVDVDHVPERLPEDVALCAFRVAQEALRNVTRHARASAVNISLATADGALRLAVRDNGIGFDPDEPQRAASLGHASMRERVRLLGGVLEIRSVPGFGTTIQTSIPIAAAPA